jgi:hypothetical protein
MSLGKWYATLAMRTLHTGLLNYFTILTRQLIITSQVKVENFFTMTKFGRGNVKVI